VIELFALQSSSWKQIVLVHNSLCAVITLHCGCATIPLIAGLCHLTPSI